MGACESAELKELRQQSSKSRKIDKDLQPRSSDIKQKMLLLGPGESGKSTCLKQMKILHHNGFTDAEVNEKKIVVYLNTVQGMAAILQAMEQKMISFEDPSLEEHAKLVKKLSVEELAEISTELKKALLRLWADKGVQKGYSYRNEFHITESSCYFFENLERISSRDYRPSSQDILHTRVPTTGVVQVYFNFRGIQFEVFDVGGQRSERRKWIHCFDDCNAIIFVAAISEYDQVIKEDNMTNRLVEAIDLFGGIANSQYFTSCSIILFLNKKDLFEEKIKDVPLTMCFRDYTGGDSYENGVRYIRKKFEANVKNGRTPYVHQTCATDTTQVTVVINSVIDTIVQENLKDTGMM